MNKERLLNVAKALRESPAPDDFDMGSYANGCGTPGCALGHYAARTDLQAAFRLAQGLTQACPTLQTVSGSYAAWDSKAVLEHFGIDEAQAIELFDVVGCNAARTAVEAAEFIERFVAREDES